MSTRRTRCQTSLSAPSTNAVLDSSPTVTEVPRDQASLEALPTRRLRVVPVNSRHTATLVIHDSRPNDELHRETFAALAVVIAGLITVLAASHQGTIEGLVVLASLVALAAIFAVTVTLWQSMVMSRRLAHIDPLTDVVLATSITQGTQLRHCPSSSTLLAIKDSRVTIADPPLDVSVHSVQVLRDSWFRPERFRLDTPVGTFLCSSRWSARPALRGRLLRRFLQSVLLAHQAGYPDPADWAER